MSVDDLKTLLGGALRPGVKLAVENYTDSNGVVSNLEVEVLPENGYEGLVKESLQLLEDGKVLKPETSSEEDWAAAVAEQKAAWEKSLAGENKKSGWGDGYVKHASGYYTTEKDENVVYVKGLKRLSRSEISRPEEEKAVKSSQKTLCKKHLQKTSPVGSYVAAIKLAEGKFASVRVTG